MSNKNNTNYPDILYEKLKEFNEIEDNKNLFDYQRNVFNYITKMDSRGVLLYHAVGSGKCMSIDTPILMYDGTIKKIQDIKQNELIMGDDSTSRKILSLARGVDNMYNIWYNSKKYTVNESHILCLKVQGYPKIHSNDFGHKIYFVNNNTIDSKIFLYGSLNKKVVDSQAYKFYTDIELLKNDIIHIMVSDYIKLDNEIKKTLNGYRSQILFSYQYVSLPSYKFGLFISSITGDNISIPHIYKINSLEVRRNILAGIFDNIGNKIIYKGFDAICIFLTKKVKKLLDDIIFISDTIGLLNKCTKSSEDKYKIIFYGNELTNIYTQNNKLDNISPENYKDGYKIKIKFYKIDNYFGFEINNNRRYVLADCTVTHNTMTSISIAEHFKKLNREVIILSSKSLQINYKKEIINYNKIINGGEINEEQAIDNYKFVTSNAKNMLDKLTGNISKGDDIDMVIDNINKSSLDNKVIIVDEAHNLFNSISNGSKIANGFYDLIMKANNIKLIFLTGTPLINDPFELCICFNMIYGPIYLDKKRYTTILPEHYGDFKKFFIEETQNNIKNEDKLKNRIFGLTSYYGDFYKDHLLSISNELKKLLKKENYPDRLPIKFEIIEMSQLQNAEYIKARAIEKLENSFNVQGAGIVKDQNSSSTSYRIKSRQLSNIYIDSTIPIEKYNLDKYSPKLLNIYKNISKQNNQISLVYSTFLEYGILAFANILEKLGNYKKYNPNENPENDIKYYAIFSGNQSSEEKEDILKKINSDDNKYGNIINVLLISKSGTEGIDLKNIRSIHITEPYWNYSLIQQIIARGVRYKSHIALPESERNVQTYVYLSDYNKGYLKVEKEKILEKSKIKKISKNDKIELTTDINMFKNAVKNQELISKFLKCIASTSIECKFFNHNNLNYDCFSCINNDKPLYVIDLYSDMSTTNNCIRTKKIKAEEIIINDIKYFYSKDVNNLIHVYEYIPNINGYVEIFNKDIINKISTH